MKWDRMHYTILKVLHKLNCTSSSKGATIQEMMAVIGTARSTTYRYLRDLLDAGYVERGCKVINADTWYLTDKGQDLVSIVKGEG